MNTAIINIKTEPKVKKEAQKIAEEFGLSLSSVINAYLKQLIRTKTLQLHLTSQEQPTPFLLQSLQESKADIAAGRLSPKFNNAQDAVAWLNR